MKNGIKAVVLAAGKGTRLRTEGVDLPKVLRQAAGRPLLGYVLEELSFLEKEDVVLVVGYEREKVLAAYPEYPHAVQEPQQGTGHAVQCAREALAGFDGSVLVCYGDMPLMKGTSYRTLMEAHQESGADCTLLSGLTEPVGAVLAFALLRPFLNGLLLGVLFGAVAGIMVYIAVEELIPSSRQYGHDRPALWATLCGICVMPLTHLFQT